MQEIEPKPEIFVWRAIGENLQEFEGIKPALSPGSVIWKFQARPRSGQRFWIQQVCCQQGQRKLQRKKRLEGRFQQRQDQQVHRRWQWQDQGLKCQKKFCFLLS